MCHALKQIEVRTDLIRSSANGLGEVVIKDPETGEFFELGGEETFLLDQLDTADSYHQIQTAYRRRFGRVLEVESIIQFVELANSCSFLCGDQNAPSTAHQALSGPPASASTASGDARSPNEQTLVKRQSWCGKGSVLYWRKSIYDPDKLLAWVEPRVHFIWTPIFLFASGLLLCVSLLILCVHWNQITSHYVHSITWQAACFAWVTVFAATLCHEMAHGLTCKHYGGAVHEIGFLSMYFVPCMYCNVSDAWLFSEKRKRLWVTASGTYCDLCIWALSICLWRVTLQDQLLNYLAWIVFSVLSVRLFFNVNPFLKLDGYYFLSDLLSMPNLRQRAIGHVMAHLRWIGWADARPERQPRHVFLLVYGALSWLCSICVVVVILLGLIGLVCFFFGVVGGGLMAVATPWIVRDIFLPLVPKRFATHLRQRYGRIARRFALVVGILTLLAVIPWNENAGGDFEVHPLVQVQVRAPVAGFLKCVCKNEGQVVDVGERLLELEIPDLDSRIVRKRAELLESTSEYELLKAGVREEEISQQRRRVSLARQWRDLAERKLLQERQAVDQEVSRYKSLLSQHEAEREYSRLIFKQAQNLDGTEAISVRERMAAQRLFLVSSAKYDQTVAEQRAFSARGTLTAETELAEQEKLLGDQVATLELMKAGTRPEEIRAAESKVARLREELRYLQNLRESLRIVSPISGVIVTPRLANKVGDYFDEGELICEIEAPDSFEVEISLDEERVAHVRPGQPVRLKARALPFEVVEAEVSGVAPRATKDEIKTRVSVYASIPKGTGLRSGMSGYARIDCGRSYLGPIAVRSLQRTIRTEFWW